MNHQMLRSKVVVSIVLLASLGLAGCSTSSDHGSRHTIYESLNDLVSDSTTIAEVAVQDRKAFRETDTESAHTISTVRVIAVSSPPRLAASNQNDVITPKVGAMIAVRQLGDPEASSDTPYLMAGEQYILFLTPTMLPGASPSDFYVTGGVAGIYQFNGDGYMRVSKDADRIPDSVRLEDLNR